MKHILEIAGYTWCVLILLGLGVIVYGFLFGKDVDESGNYVE